MKRFFARKPDEPVHTASASSGSAAQPVEQQRSVSSAKPGGQLTSVKAVQIWLGTLDIETATADIRRIKTAVDVLMHKPKPRKEDVRPLCATWSVQRTMKHKERLQSDVLADLTSAKVIAASNQAIANAAQPASTSTCAPQNAKRDREDDLDISMPTTKPKLATRKRELDSAEEASAGKPSGSESKLATRKREPASAAQASAGKPSGSESKTRRLTQFFTLHIGSNSLTEEDQEHPEARGGTTKLVTPPPAPSSVRPGGSVAAQRSRAAAAWQGVLQ